MNDRQVVELTLDVIDVRERLRAVDPLLSEALARSIEARGLLSPIEVRASETPGRYDLIAGAHRLYAVALLQWKTISAFVRVPADDLESRLIEIEENLVRHELTELDRATFLKEWKDIYLRMTNARGRGRPKKAEQSSEFPLRFSEAVSARLGITPRYVDQSIKRTELLPKLRAALCGHPAADHGSLLDALVKLDLDVQEEVAIALRDNPQMTIAQLRALIQADAKVPDRFAQFELLWAKMSTAERGKVRRFVIAHSGRATPDESAA
jgi:ParB family chromosome partitioning protein